MKVLQNGDFQRGQFVGACLAGASVTKTVPLLTFRRRDLNPPCSATVPRFLERSLNF